MNSLQLLSKAMIIYNHFGQKSLLNALGRGMGFYFNKLESPSTKDYFVPNLGEILEKKLLKLLNITLSFLFFCCTHFELLVLILLEQCAS